MHIGSDFFLWFRFVIELVKLFISIFGNEDEKEELKNNHVEP